MGEHKRNTNSQLSSQGKLPPRETPLRADIAVNNATRKIVIVYDRHINNVSYTLDQLDSHIKGLIGAARMLECDFMEEVKL